MQWRDGLQWSGDQTRTRQTNNRPLKNTTKPTNLPPESKIKAKSQQHFRKRAWTQDLHCEEQLEIGVTKNGWTAWFWQKTEVLQSVTLYTRLVRLSVCLCFFNLWAFNSFLSLSKFHFSWFLQFRHHWTRKKKENPQRFEVRRTFTFISIIFMAPHWHLHLYISFFCSLAFILLFRQVNSRLWTAPSASI